jgi:hypothetical protein
MCNYHRCLSSKISSFEERVLRGTEHDLGEALAKRARIEGPVPADFEAYVQDLRANVEEQRLKLRGVSKAL